MKKIDWLLLVLIIAGLLAVFMLYSTAMEIKQKNIECVVNPLVYGAKSLEDTNGAKVACQCNLLNRGNAPTLYFDGNGSWFK